ncbi:hypothetical protein V2J09_022561 [Rumex salicifolius]
MIWLEESEKHRAIVSKNEYAFRGSRKGYAGIEEEMILEIQKQETSSQGRPSSAFEISIPRHELWLAGRKRKDGIMDELIRKVLTKWSLYHNKHPKVKLTFLDDKITVLGKKEHPGHMEDEILLLKRELGKREKKDNHLQHENAELPSTNNGNVQDISFPEVLIRHLLKIRRFMPNFHRQQEQYTLKKERVAWQARYIADAMKSAQKNQVFFAPYNAKEMKLWIAQNNLRSKLAKNKIDKVRDQWVTFV